MNLVNFISLLMAFSATASAFPQELKTAENSGIPGGVNTVDVNSSEINELAKKVMVEVNQNTGYGFSSKQKVNRILKAKKQVVAGTLTTLELEICPDSCGDGAVNERECKICVAKAWEKPWENFFQVTEFSCKSPDVGKKNNRRTRPM